MPLTPIDIQQKTFGPELRGYNMDEVDDFLDEVVATLKDYDQRIRDAQDQIRALEAEVTTRGQDETAISRALVAAQKQADSVLEEAHQEAERIRVDAHEEADHLRADRDAERMALTQEMARMRATVADLKRRMVELANSASEDLDAMDSAIATASETVSGTDTSQGPDFDPTREEASKSPEHLDEPEIWQVPGNRDSYPEVGGEEGGEEDLEPESSLPGAESEEGIFEEDLESESSLPGAESEEGYGEEYEELEELEEHEEGEASDMGGLADEMADEAAGSPSDGDQDPSPQPSRRPWERGSV